MVLNKTRISKRLAALVVGVALMLNLLFGSYNSAQPHAYFNADTTVVVADGGGIVPPPGQG